MRTRISQFRDRGAPWWHLRYVLGQIPPNDPSEAMRQGSLLDTMMTEPHALERRYVAKPDGMSFANKDGKAWREVGDPAAVEAVRVAFADTFPAASNASTASVWLVPQVSPEKEWLVEVAVPTFVPSR